MDKNQLENEIRSNITQWVTLLTQSIDIEKPESHIYQQLKDLIEVPTLKTVNNFTQDNQTKAAKVLGINRGTWRIKMQRHNLL